MENMPDDKRLAMGEILLGIFCFPIARVLSSIFETPAENWFLNPFARIWTGAISLAGILLIIDGVLRLLDYSLKDLLKELIEKLKR
jgi:hypothetical protein